MNIVMPCPTHILSDATLLARTPRQLTITTLGNDAQRQNRQHRNHREGPDEA